MIRTGAQIRAARALLGLKRADLARAAKLHPNAVKYCEARQVVPLGFSPPYAVARIEKALRELGVIATADPHPGVQLSMGDNF